MHTPKFKTFSNEDIIAMIESSLIAKNPLNLAEEDFQKHKYLPVAKKYFDQLYDEVTYSDYWVRIQNIFLEQYNEKLEKKVCKAIVNDVFYCLNKCESVDDLRQYDCLKNMDANFTLKVHENFILEWKDYNYLYINGEFFWPCEEQDIEDFLPELLWNEELIYVLYKHKRASIRGISNYRTFNKDKIEIDTLVNDSNVVAIFDNKKLIYKSDFNLRTNVGFDKSDIKRNEFQLFGGQGKKGYDWWWHSFTAYNKKTGEEKPFYIEFFLCNPKLAKDEPVFGQLKENKEKGIRPSYLMVNVGCWGKKHLQLHRFFAYKDINIKKKAPFSIAAGDCYLDEKSTYGVVKVNKEDASNHPEYMSDYGKMSWDLKINKIVPFNVGYGASSLFRKLQLFEMFWHAEGMKSTFEGTIILDGEEYEVIPEKSFGYADKNWGKDFTSPWVWLSSNNLVSKITGKRLENSVFDIGGGRPKVGFIALNRKLLSAFYYEGRCFEFNFSKFWTHTRTKFESKETETEILWHVEQKTWRNKMVVDISCKKEDMLLINYEAPDGRKRHNKLWNGGNGKGTITLYHKNKIVDVIEASNVGCEYGEFTE